MADQAPGGNQTAIAGVRAALHLLLQEQGLAPAELKGSLDRLVGAIPAGAAPEVAAAAARARAATAWRLRPGCCGRWTMPSPRTA